MGSRCEHRALFIILRRIREYLTLFFNTPYSPTKSWPLKPHSTVLDAIFDSEKMKALASFQDLYVGLEPYANNGQIGGGVIKKTAPAVFGLLAALELHPTNKKAGGEQYLHL